MRLLSRLISRNPFGYRIHQLVSYILVFVVGYAVGSIITWAFGLCGTEESFSLSEIVYSENTHTESPINLKMESPLPKEKHFLIVLILSSPDRYEQRHVTRTTWLNTNKTANVIHLFAIGTAKLPLPKVNTLQSENEAYKDLLLLRQVKDSYFSLTYKLLIALEWIAKHMNFKFLLKVDDDSFAQLELLTSELQKFKQQNRLYMGFFDGRAKIKKSGKWAEKKWFLCDLYLPHALGGGYVLSADLVQFIASNARLLSLYNNEDVALGTWLAPLNIQRIHDPRFDTEYQSRGCSNSYIVTHKQSSDQMKEKYYNLKNSNKLCTTEYKLQNSYIYNWTVLPSKCCNRNNISVP